MKPRVLVVDDDPELAMMVRDVLQKGGFETWVAEPLHAERVFEAKPFDLLITDKNMPGLSGYELIGQLRGRYPHLPVVMMSAYPELTGANTPIQGYLAKPFSSVKTIIDVARRTIDLAQRLAEVRKWKLAG
ncbi:MAG: response regulator [Myxococcaceae bacterium]|nr:response regulator [Myxococcaceae bacterium]